MAKKQVITSAPLPTRDELAASLEEAMLRLALYDCAAAESEQIVRDFDALPSEEKQVLGQPSAAAYRRFQKDLKARFRRAKVQRFSRHVLLPLGKAAAALVLVLSLGISTVVASSDTLRAAVFDLVFTRQATHTEIQLVENTQKAFEVPAEWKGRYYPSFIPEGYKMVKIDSEEGTTSTISLINKDGHLMHFSENTLDTYTNIDTENANVKNVLIRGYKSLMSIKNGRVILVWSADERYFILNIAGDENAAIQVAESLRLIR